MHDLQRSCVEHSVAQVELLVLDLRCDQAHCWHISRQQKVFAVIRLALDLKPMLHCLFDLLYRVLSIQIVKCT